MDESAHADAYYRGLRSQPRLESGSRPNVDAQEIDFYLRVGVVWYKMYVSMQ